MLEQSILKHQLPGLNCRIYKMLYNNESSLSSFLVISGSVNIFHVIIKLFEICKGPYRNLLSVKRIPSFISLEKNFERCSSVFGRILNLGYNKDDGFRRNRYCFTISGMSLTSKPKSSLACCIIS